MPLLTPSSTQGHGQGCRTFSALPSPGYTLNDSPPSGRLVVSAAGLRLWEGAAAQQGSIRDRHGLRQSAARDRDMDVPSTTLGDTPPSDRRSVRVLATVLVGVIS